MKKIRAIVLGKVQGVNFRMYTRQKAKQLGVCGYVSNLENGNVEIVATGENEQLDALIQWAKSGSPSAIVNSLEIEEITGNGEQFESFEIRY